MKYYFVYIMTNAWNTVLYTGVTGNLEKRIYEHKNKLLDGFTKKNPKWVDLSESF